MKPQPTSFISRSPEETLQFAEGFTAGLKDKTVLLFSGDLGAGKTTFIKGMAKACGISPHEVLSPTFTLLHIYEGEKRKLFHFDLYRLAQLSEFEHLGFADLLDTSGAIFCIEWPEKTSYDFENKIHLHIELLDNTLRKITLNE